MDCPLLGLKRLGRRCSHLFSVDTSRACRSFISQAHNPKKIYKDVKDLNIPLMEEADYVHFSPPCQDYSPDNSNAQGANVVRGQLHIHP